MIALNELIKNSEIYEQRYKAKGLRVNLNRIFVLEKKCKELQLKTEKLRADCNKFCGEVAILRNEEKDTSYLLNKILKIDSQIKINTAILNRQTKKLNKYLSKLHNLPDHENSRHVQLSTSKNQSSLSDLDVFIKSITKIEDSNLTIDKYLKTMENQIVSNLPKIVKCKIGYLILTTQDDFDDLKTKIMQYFKDNAQHVIEVSCKKLYKSNSSSYLVHLNRFSSVYLEVIKEYMTRENKIKYHDEKTDMTKFANQLNIIINPNKFHF